MPELHRNEPSRGDGAATGTGASRLAPRTKKGVQTRSQLVDAAKVVFERDGFLNARIVDITETARLATGSFYHYFDSKEQIFREVAALQEHRLTAAGTAETADASLSSRARTGSEVDAPAEPEPVGETWQRIRRANRRYLERYRDASALMGVIEEVSRYDAEVNAARMATMKHFVERAERAIVDLQKRGLADPRLHPSLVADALGAMVGRFAEQWLVQGYRDYEFDQAVEQLTLIWGNALGIESEAKSESRV